MALRLLRIAAVAGGLAFLFHLSQQAGAVRGNEAVPGRLWAIGIVSLLLLVRAVVTERTRGPEDALQKDLLWGLSAGGIITILLQA